MIALQYVFAIAAGSGVEAGGELYRSDYYGAHESWKNITADLPGLSLAEVALKCFQERSDQAGGLIEPSETTL